LFPAAGCCWQAESANNDAAANAAIVVLCMDTPLCCGGAVTQSQAMTVSSRGS